MQLRKVGKTVMHSLIIIMLIVGLYVQTAQAAIQATTNASVGVDKKRMYLPKIGFNYILWIKSMTKSS